MAHGPVREIRHVLLVLGGIAALIGFSVAFYAALWWLTGLLWDRIAPLLAWA